MRTAMNKNDLSRGKLQILCPENHNISLSEIEGNRTHWFAKEQVVKYKKTVRQFTHKLTWQLAVKKNMYKNLLQK